MFTSNLKHIMELEDLSIQQLSKMTKVSTNTIFRARSSIFIGACTIATLEKIAEALNCSPKELFEYEKDRIKKQKSSKR